MNETDKFDTWALVELFGHQKIVGRVTEATIGGCALLRVDVPANGSEPAYTKFYGSGAIYAMTPVSEEIARTLLERIRPEPISRYDLPRINPPADVVLDHDSSGWPGDDDDDDAIPGDEDEKK